MKVLIVGIDSLVGGAVARALKLQNHDVIGTSRRSAQASEDMIPYDLSWDHDAWPTWPDDIDAAFVAAAMSRQKDCADNPDLAQHINVDQTLRLIEDLRARGIYVVYPSTNLVLACDTPLQSVDASLYPLGMYGETKAEVERGLAGKPGTGVVRLPKILDGQSGILKDWRDKLLAQQPITVFSDMMLAPVSLLYAADVLVQIMEKRLDGGWQISGNCEISYLELARMWMARLGLQDCDSLIAAGSAADAGIISPRHPGMDMGALEAVLGITAQGLDEMIEDCGKEI